MLGLGLPELVIIFVVVLLLFGPSKLPQLGKGLGEALGGFRKAISGKDKEEPAAAGREQTTQKA
jgi:sec-independent protein translocase protein TatA